MERLYTAIMSKATKVDFDVATVLNVIDLCKDMRTMPLPGGLFDQDSLFVYLYEYVLQCRQTRQELDDRKQQASARTSTPRRR